MNITDVIQILYVTINGCQQEQNVFHFILLTFRTVSDYYRVTFVPCLEQCDTQIEFT